MLTIGGHSFGMLHANSDVVFLYGSETGTAEDVAFKLSNDLSSTLGLTSVALNACDFPPQEVSTQRCIVFVVATTGMFLMIYFLL